MTAGTLVPEALRLPAAPLLAAVDQAAHDRRTSVSDVLGRAARRPVPAAERPAPPPSLKWRPSATGSAAIPMSSTAPPTSA